MYEVGASHGDMTYCTNRGCPFLECRRHMDQTSVLEAGTVISMADLSGTCRQYIGWLVDQCEGEEHG